MKKALAVICLIVLLINCLLLYPLVVKYFIPMISGAKFLFVDPVAEILGGLSYNFTIFIITGIPAIIYLIRYNKKKNPSIGNVEQVPPETSTINSMLSGNITKGKEKQTTTFSISFLIIWTIITGIVFLGLGFIIFSQMKLSGNPSPIIIVQTPEVTTPFTTIVQTATVTDVVTPDLTRDATSCSLDALMNCWVTEYDQYLNIPTLNRNGGYVWFFFQENGFVEIQWDTQGQKGAGGLQCYNNNPCCSTFISNNQILLARAHFDVIDNHKLKYLGSMGKYSKDIDNWFNHSDYVTCSIFNPGLTPFSLYLEFGNIPLLRPGQR